MNAQILQGPSNGGDGLLFFQRNDGSTVLEELWVIL